MQDVGYGDQDRGVFQDCYRGAFPVNIPSPTGELVAGAVGFGLYSETGLSSNRPSTKRAKGILHQKPQTLKPKPDGPSGLGFRAFRRGSDILSSKFKKTHNIWGVKVCQIRGR